MRKRNRAVAEGTRRYENSRARTRARERGVLGREENATRDAVTRVPETGRVASRRTRERRQVRAVAYLFPPLSANRLSPSFSLSRDNRFTPPLPQGGRSFLSRPRFSLLAPPVYPSSRAPNFCTATLLIYLFSGNTCYFLLSLLSVPSSLFLRRCACHSIPFLPASHAKPSTVRTVSPCASLRLRPSSHTAVTFANVHCYHATALAPPPGTEGEINESKVRREGS